MSIQESLLDCWLLSNLGELQYHPGREPRCIYVYYPFPNTAQPNTDTRDNQSALPFTLMDPLPDLWQNLA